MQLAWSCCNGSRSKIHEIPGWFQISGTSTPFLFIPWSLFSAEKHFALESPLQKWAVAMPIPCVLLACFASSPPRELSPPVPWGSLIGGACQVCAQPRAGQVIRSWVGSVALSPHLLSLWLFSPHPSIQNICLYCLSSDLKVWMKHCRPQEGWEHGQPFERTPLTFFLFYPPLLSS